MTPETLKIIAWEVSRAIRLHPSWAHLAEDLAQDAAEAVVRYAPEPGSHTRVAARGAIIRCAMDYFGVSRRTGRSLGYSVDADLVNKMVEPSQPIEAYEIAQVLDVAGRGLPSREAQVWALHRRGLSLRAIGIEVGLSHEGVNLMLPEIYEAVRRAA